MADTAGFAAFSGCQVTPYPDLLDELPARERKIFFPDVEALISTIADKIHAVASI
jgi:hypothetical protein